MPNAGIRLLVRGTNWIGDSIMTLPALHELRRHQPEARIALMVRRWVRALFEGLECIDELVECDQAGSQFTRLLDNTRELRKGRYDAALLLPNAIAPALQAACAGIPRRMGYATDARNWLLTRSTRRSPRLRGRHQCYHYLALLHQLGLSPVDYLADPEFIPNASMPLNESERREAEITCRRFQLDLSRPLISLSGGAHYGSAKRWFPERFAEVADALVESHQVQVALIGSGGEADLATKIAGFMRHPPILLAGKTDLRELKHLLGQSNLLITNDSGPMHLAAALGTPSVAVFGSTDAIATAPLGRNARVIRKEVACSPCLLRECPVDLRCFASVCSEEVIAAAREQLNGADKTNPSEQH